MLPFRVIQIERHGAFQQNAYRPSLPNASLLTHLSFESNLATSRWHPDRLSRRDFAVTCPLNSGRWMQKNERIIAKWAPISSRQWVTSRCSRKQTTKPRLTDTRTHVRVSPKFADIAQESVLGNYVSNRYKVENRCFRKQTTKPRLTGTRTHIKHSANFAKIAQGADELHN
jgi:hypothetical protein